MRFRESRKNIGRPATSSWGKSLARKTACSSSNWHLVAWCRHSGRLCDRRIRQSSGDTGSRRQLVGYLRRFNARDDQRRSVRRVTSMSTLIPSVTSLIYTGHVVRNGRKVCMSDFAIGNSGKFNVPTILLVGTSMSSGKTTTGRFVVHELERMGKRVIGAKITGAGRYRDILSFSDAGAEQYSILSMPGCRRQSCRRTNSAMRYARSCTTSTASIPTFWSQRQAPRRWNRTTARRPSRNSETSNIRCKILCASDPYAVVGVEKAFGLIPDLVTGLATSTSGSD